MISHSSQSVQAPRLVNTTLVLPLFQPQILNQRGCFCFSLFFLQLQSANMHFICRNLFSFCLPFVLYAILCFSFPDNKWETLTHTHIYTLLAQLRLIKPCFVSGKGSPQDQIGSFCLALSSSAIQLQRGLRRQKRLSVAWTYSPYTHTFPIGEGAVWGGGVWWGSQLAQYTVHLLTVYWWVAANSYASHDKMSIHCSFQEIKSMHMEKSPDVDTNL